MTPGDKRPIDPSRYYGSPPRLPPEGHEWTEDWLDLDTRNKITLKMRREGDFEVCIGRAEETHEPNA